MTAPALQVLQVRAPVRSPGSWELEHLVLELDLIAHDVAHATCMWAATLGHGLDVGAKLALPLGSTWSCVVGLFLGWLVGWSARHYTLNLSSGPRLYPRVYVREQAARAPRLVRAGNPSVRC